MKKIISITLALLAITLMSSCLGSSDDNQTTYHTVTPAERSVIIKNIYNSYTGNLKYVNSSSKLDSIPSTLSFINDSTAMVDYPVSILANYLTLPKDSLARNALLTAPNQPVECRVQVPSYILTTYWDKYYTNAELYELAFYPTNKTLAFQHANHSYELTFTYDNIYYNYRTCSPVMQWTNKQACAFLLLGTLKVDSNSARAITLPSQFVGKCK